MCRPWWLNYFACIAEFLFTNSIPIYQKCSVLNNLLKGSSAFLYFFQIIFLLNIELNEFTLLGMNPGSVNAVKSKNVFTHTIRGIYRIALFTDASLVMYYILICIAYW